MTIVEQAAHSPIGASSAERWWNCPGSVQLLKQVPDKGSTIYAATGTVAHSLAEKWLKSGLYSPEWIRHQEVGRSYVQDGFEVEITEEMFDAVEVYKNVVWHYIQKHSLDIQHDLQTEARFTLSHIDAEAFGTCDAVVTVPMNRIIIIDYKHGQGHAVEVKDNKQLLYYALGAYYALPEADRNDLEFVETVIVQPRARHIDGSVRTHLYRVHDLLNFERQLISAVSVIRSGSTEMEPGAHCRWCDAKPLCPAIREEISRQAALDFGSVDTAPVQLPVQASLEPERLSQLLKNANTIMDWCRSIQELAFVLAERGTEIPGYKLVEKFGNRRWADEKAVQDAFELEFGDEIFTKKLRSPAQMEKLLKKARASEVVPYLGPPTVSKTLVPEDDERDGVSTGAAADFV